MFSLAEVLTPLGGQPVPSRDENISFLVTFGKSGETSWGDDDFYSVWFFSIPKEYTQQFYIRVFDPDTGGENDEIQASLIQGPFLQSMEEGCRSDRNADSQGLLNGLNYKGGNLLASRVFGSEPRYDNNTILWPFSPQQVISVQVNSYIFKVVCEGTSGDDGTFTVIS